MRAITVCVDMADLLVVTLPYNRHHFDEVLVVTSHNDIKTQHITAENRAQVFLTDAFHRHGEDFNKWAALEEGLDSMGRHGWLCIMDPDVLFPKELPRRTVNGCPWDIHCLSKANIGRLFTPLRRMWTDWPNKPILPDAALEIEGVPSEFVWSMFPLHPQQREFAGYTQIFHADDPHLLKPPWHQTNWRHAGGADSAFQSLWSQECKIRPPFEVLHLGPAGVNWMGRVSPRADGTTPEGAEGRLAKLRELIRMRGQGPDRFRHERL